MIAIRDANAVLSVGAPTLARDGINRRHDINMAILGTLARVIITPMTGINATATTARNSVRAITATTARNSVRAITALAPKNNRSVTVPTIAHATPAWIALPHRPTLPATDVTDLDIVQMTVEQTLTGTVARCLPNSPKHNAPSLRAADRDPPRTRGIKIRRTTHCVTRQEFSPSRASNGL
jgi:hypothetical protein